MANETNQTTEVIKFDVQDKDAISELARVKNSMLDLQEQQSKLNKAFKDGKISQGDYAKELVKLETAIKKTNNTYAEHQKKIEQATKQTKSFNETIKDSAEKIQVAGISIGDLAGKVNVANISIAAASSAFTALVGLYAASAAGARDVESANIKLGSTFSYLGNELARLVGADGKGGGLISGLVDQFNIQFLGSGAFVRGVVISTAENNLKELEVTALTTQRVAKNALDQAEEYRRVRDNQEESFAKRQAAAEKVQGFINVREQVLVNIQKERLKNLQTLLKNDEFNLDLQKEIKQTEFEISDILEDSEGKRTEALNGINALRKEQLALTKQQQAEDEAARKFAKDTVDNLDITKQDKAAQAKDESGKRVQNATSQNELTVTTNLLKRKQEIEQSALERLDKIRLSFALKNQEYDEQTEQLKTQITLQGLKEIQIATGNAASLFKQDSAAYKLLASGRAVVNTYLGATEALRSASVLPSPLDVITKIANVAAVVGSGLKSVAAINKVQFATGGYTGNGGKYEPAGIVHRGEVVWSQQDVAAVGGPGIANAMRPTYKGYADGGFVTAPDLGLTLADVVEVVSKLPPPVVVYSEYNSFQKGVIKKIQYTER